jgi:2-oxoisovalerate ferredoxin oxidoreductase beta subunit
MSKTPEDLNGYSPVLKRSASFYDSFERKGANPDSTHYCPGCGHGILHKLIAEAVDDFGIQDRTILVNSVGCSVFAYYYFDIGNVQCAHGRAPAVATGIKRARPDSIVMTYQGDGDLAAIGGNEILHAANRGEGITVFFVNNAIYGMTGGQMAPTTLIGQKTTTTPGGRTVDQAGFPLRMVEILNTLDAPVFLARVSLQDPAHTMKTRKAVRTAIRNQVEGKGFSLVEVLSPCPTGWKMDPAEACDWIPKAMLDVFPLSQLRDNGSIGVPGRRTSTPRTQKQLVKALNLHDDSKSRREEPAVLEHPIGAKIAGFGGQGVLMLGLALAEAARAQGYRVSWLPSYGPEMRGGLDQVAPGALVVYDSSLIEDPPRRDDVRMFPVPATRIAEEIGTMRVANMVMLGAVAARLKIPCRWAIARALVNLIPAGDLRIANESAIEAGWNIGTRRDQGDQVSVPMAARPD